MRNIVKRTALASSLILAGLSVSLYASAQDAASVIPDISGKKVLVGFWHNWGSKSDGYKRGTAAEVALSAVPEGYNVITVAFMKGEGIPTFKPYNQSDAGFRAEIGKLNTQGRVVLLSLGGADAHIQLATGDAQKFADEIIRLVELYGFDGLDIDLEGNAILAGANQTEIPAALKIVKQRYPGFIISMAPEFPYLRSGGSYEKLIKGLEGYYDFISPQYYNQAGDGVTDDQGLWLAQNNLKRQADFLFYLSDSLIHGSRGFIQIPADKLAIGLPSNADAAGSGYVQNEADVRSALERLTAQGTPIKGLMTWSINWDAGHDANGNAYGYEFVNRYAKLLNDNDTPEPGPDIEAPSRPGKPVAAVNAGTIALKWNASVDNIGVDHYEIWRDGVKTGQSLRPEWQDTLTQPATTYSYHVVAADRAGNRSEASENTLVTSASEDTQAPSVPDEVKASSISQTSATLSWKAAIDNVAVSSYQVWRDGQKVASSATTSWTDNGLQAGKTYHYQVTASDAAGNRSEKSQPIAVTTLKKSDAGYSQWSSQKIYNTGDKVSWKGHDYKAKWWTQDNEPGDSDVWEDLNPVSGGEWRSGKVYLSGEEATYQGKHWVAQWWTKGDIPGSSNVWKLK